MLLTPNNWVVLCRLFRTGIDIIALNAPDDPGGKLEGKEYAPKKNGLWYFPTSAVEETGAWACC